MAETPRQTFERSQERKRTARPRDLESDYRARAARKRARAERGEAPRSEEATSIDEALEAERETGRREGARLAPPRAATSTPSPTRGVNLSQYSGGSAPGVTVPMVIDIGIITVDELTVNHRLPIPSRLLVAFVIFGGLGLAKNTTAARAASAFAWGIVVATFYGTTNPSPGVGALNKIASFLAGGNAQKGTAASGSLGTPGGAANPAGPPPINPFSPASPGAQAGKNAARGIGGAFNGIFSG
jgi:hypothetical protein